LIATGEKKMRPISDKERAARYRRKLEDLWKASGDFISRLQPADFLPEAREAYESLSEERSIIRNQLDVEERFCGPQKDIFIEGEQIVAFEDGEDGQTFIRVLVPDGQRSAVLAAMHGLGQPSSEASPSGAPLSTTSE
jgi:hypothetical protein